MIPAPKDDGEPITSASVREYGHRVGASLQTVASLAKRSERALLAGADRDVALAALRMVQRSLAAIAFVQHLLYTPTPNTRAMRRFVRSLGAHLKTIYDRKNVDIIIRDAADPPVASAHTVGLILCELITNALRHGFSKDRRGEVVVSIQSLPNGFLRLIVEDNGKGYQGAPPDITVNGLGLVNEFVAGALGSLAPLDRCCGAAWQVDLPPK
ncbi:MAG: sensor histidine kinase [Pseudomonadota bacterium]